MRVLIVEDEPIIAMELETIVLDRAPDAEVVHASSICEARDAIDRALDVAFLDIDVTDGKTYELALELKKLQVPFVFVSAASLADTPTELADESFIPKPFAPTEITGTLDALARKERGGEGG